MSTEPGAAKGFENAFGQVIPNHAIMLKAISYVKKRGQWNFNDRWGLSGSR
jgi:hypothetical protein